MALLSTATFALLSFLPGDPVTMFILSNPRVRSEDVARLRKLRGLDRGFVERYSRWLIGHHPPLPPPDVLARDPRSPIVVDVVPGSARDVEIDVSTLVIDRARTTTPDGESPPLTLIPLFGARARGLVLTASVDEPGVYPVWFVVKDAHGQAAVSRIDVHARVPESEIRNQLAPPGLDDRLVDTSPELDLDVLDPAPGLSPRAVRLVDPFVVDEPTQTFALDTLVGSDLLGSDDVPVRYTILAGPGHVVGDRYHPPTESGRHAVVVSVHFGDGGVERGAFVVETGPVEDRSRFVHGALWVFTGDLEALGYSSSYKRPIHELLFSGGTHSRLFMTLSLMGPALLLAFLLAFPIGVLAALRRGTVIDKAVLAVSTLTLSVPVFWLGLLAVVVLAERMRLLPSGGAMTPGLDATTLDLVIDRVRHLVLPVSVLALGMWAPLVRHVRGALLEILPSEFLVAARARGLPETVVIWKHAMKNALPPVITAGAMFLPSLVGGALLTETVFAWPGLGRLQYEAVLANDSNLAMVTFLVEAALVLLASLLSDVVVMAVDPRSRGPA